MADTNDPVSPRTTASDMAHHRASLSTLPPEIFDNIACNLAGRDLKALRLVQTNNDPTIVRNLFRRIRLSILNFDRHVFLTVASQPHLAENVQILEWATYSNNTAETIEWLRNLEPKHDEELEKLARQFADACWVDFIPLASTSSSNALTDASLEKRELLMMALDDFQPALAAAVAAMPRIHIIEIMGAPLWRPIGTPELDGPLAASAKMTWDSYWDRSHDDRVPLEFLRFAVQVQRRQRWPAEKASTTLEDYSTGHKLSLFGTPQQDVFEAITSVYFCIGDVGKDYMDSMISMLLRAKGLQTLVLSISLCMGFRENGQLERNLFKNFQQRGFGWPQLHTIELCDLFFFKDELVSFLALHASTLRCLSFFNCHFTVGSIDDLASSLTLNLETLAIHNDEHEATVGENEVIEYLCGSRLEWRHMISRLGTSDPITHNLPDQLVSISRDIPLSITTDVSVVAERHLTNTRFSEGRYANRWRWGRVKSYGKVYYWPAAQGEEGEPTTLWEFRHRYRHLEMEYYEDRYYDGDNQPMLPTPFGRRFRLFVEEQTESLGHGFEDGQIVIPETAVEFTEEKKQSLRTAGRWPVRRSETSGL